VTDFRLILADPYRYALERVLGLEPKDDRARELDGAGFGGLAHKVLEEFADTPEAMSEEAAKVRATLDTLLDRAARLRFGGDALPAVRIQVEQLRARLAGFARWQAGWVREGWRMERAEAVPAGDGVAFPVDGEPILLKGKLDRVDRNQRTGEWCVLDYKTGEGGLDPDAAHRVGPAGAKRWVDLQLPLYHRLVPALQAEGGGSLVPRDAQADVRVGYILLAQDPEEVGARLAEWSSAELEEAEEVARAAVRLLRKNRFVFVRESSAIRVGDPLSVVIGGGVLRLDEEGDDGAL
jgi:ATP-dependent helicase/nuclease subunit B